MAKTKPEAVPLATPAAPREPSFDAAPSAWTGAGEAPPCPGYYPTAGPLGDLMAAEAVLDLLRLAVEKDFAGDRLECRQESAVIAAAHALRLVHRARLAYAEALAVALSAGVSRPAAR